MVSGKTDPFRTLGVPPTATAAEITHAYRGLLRELHPDTRTGGDDLAVPADAVRLAEVLAAYAALRDRNSERGRHRDGGHVAGAAQTSTPSPPASPQPAWSPTSTVQIPVRYRTNTINHPRARRPPLWAGPAVVTAADDLRE